MKATFQTDEIGRVTLAYDSEGWDGEAVRIVREFTCPPDGGYVRERRNGDWKQVCDRLSHMGSTLTAPSRAQLIDIIRREYRAMRRAERLES